MSEATTREDDMSKNSANPHLVPWITWGALLLSQAMYLVVLVLVSTDESRHATEDFSQTLVYALVGAAVVVAAIIPFVRKISFFEKLRDGSFDSLQSLRGSYFNACIVSWALAESIAIFGFVLSFLSGELLYYVGFVIPAAILFIAFRPRLRRYEAEWKENEPERKETEETSSGHW